VTKFNDLLINAGISLLEPDRIRDQIASAVMLTGDVKVIEATLDAAYRGKKFRSERDGDRVVTKTQIISDAVRHLAASGQIDFEEMIKLVDERA
jgi:hypothetical protein